MRVGADEWLIAKARAAGMLGRGAVAVGEIDLVNDKPAERACSMTHRDQRARVRAERSRGGALVNFENRQEPAIRLPVEVDPWIGEERSVCTGCRKGRRQTEELIHRRAGEKLPARGVNAPGAVDRGENAGSKTLRRAANRETLIGWFGAELVARIGNGLIEMGEREECGI